ncbi:hypothetical protein M1P97_19830 [Parabacteroides sp. GYB001]|uniref:hypothetical protein n=1 Tax=Parabacteroides leei TaxID=2939491 RepID=UPI002017004E|nr:hypothetical protein [Parabacteroides leei]MCL3853536.1 hypothetical protein [Parabacteroides leei]
MERVKLYEELEFVRSQIQIFKERSDSIDEGNWRKNVSNDFDKGAIWSSYQRILSELRALLKHSYDAE